MPAGKFFDDVSVLVMPLGADKVSLASNYITSDIIGLSKTLGLEFSLGKVTKESFSKLIQMIAKGDLSSRGAKDILKVMFDNGGDPDTIANEKGLIQKSDPELIRTTMSEILHVNPDSVAQYKAGKDSLLQFFVGQGMKAMKGAGNPEVIKSITLELLK